MCHRTDAPSCTTHPWLEKDSSEKEDPVLPRRPGGTSGPAELRELKKRRWPRKLPGWPRIAPIENRVANPALGEIHFEMTAARDAIGGVPSGLFKSNECLSKMARALEFPQLSASIPAVSAAICVSLFVWGSVVPVVPVVPEVPPSDVPLTAVLTRHTLMAVLRSQTLEQGDRLEER